MMADIPVQIRWIFQHDTPEVMAIEEASFPHPWTEAEMVGVLKQRFAIGMVAEQPGGGPVLGYMIYILQPTSLEVINFAVAPDLRRRGIGRQLIKRLTDKLSSQRRDRIWFETSERNLTGQLFLRSQGFKCVSVLNNAYEGCDDAAYVFEYLVRAGQLVEV